MDVGGLKPNVWKRIERLSLAWERTRMDSFEENSEPVSPGSEVVTNPGRHTRTLLTIREAEAIRTGLLHV